MRQPGRTAEGVQALVRLLAPFTEADVTPHCLRTVRLTSPMAFADEGPTGWTATPCWVMRPLMPTVSC